MDELFKYLGKASHKITADSDPDELYREYRDCSAARALDKKDIQRVIDEYLEDLVAKAKEEEHREKESLKRAFKKQRENYRVCYADTSLLVFASCSCKGISECSFENPLA